MDDDTHDLHAWAAGVRELRDAVCSDVVTWSTKARVAVIAYELLYARDLDQPADHPRQYRKQTNP